MVEPKNVLTPLIAVIISFAVVVTVGGVDLSGSQAKSLYCDIPGLSDTSQCEPVDEDTTYTAEFDIHFNRLAFQEMDYKTVAENKDFLSSLNTDLSTLAFPAETRDTQVKVTLRDSDGRIVAGDNKFYGTVVGSERNTFNFDVGNLESGNYELYMELTGEDCGILACTDLIQNLEVDVEIPHQPLGEEKNVNLVVE